MIGGFVSTLVGVASTVGGASLVVANSSKSTDDRDTTLETAGGALIIGGLVASIVGLALFMNAQPHLFDAINAYNDGLPEYGRPAVPPYAPAAPPSRLYVPPPPYRPCRTARATCPKRSTCDFARACAEVNIRWLDRPGIAVN